MQRRSILVGVILAMVVTMVLNASNVMLLATGDLSSPAMQRRNTSADEDYYAALVRKASDGYIALGNASLKEHVHDPTIVTYFPLAYAYLMRALHLEWWIALLVMNALCPFLVTLLIFIAIRGRLASDILAIFMSVIAIERWSVGLLNIVNPSMVALLSTGYLAVFLGVPKQRTFHHLLRGALLGLMLYTYPHFFLFFASIELCDVVRHLSAEGVDGRNLYRQVVITSGAFLVVASRKLWKVLTATTNDAVNDLWHRVVITDHLPAAPIHQVIVIAFIGALWRLRTTLRGNRKSIDLLIVCLAASLIALNQQILHGIEIMFALHYRNLINLLLIISAGYIIVLLCPRRWAKIILGLVAIICMLQIGIDSRKFHIVRLAAAKELEQSGMLPILQFIERMPGERVVLAPIALSNLIPSFTHHFVAMNGIARYQSITDAELAERYVLMQLVDPEEVRDPSFNIVFSVHAGNAAARARIWCQWTSLFSKSDNCRRPIEEFIRNQDVRTWLQNNVINPSPSLLMTLLEKFHVDVIVTKRPLPAVIERRCPREKDIGDFQIHLCKLRSNLRITDDDY